MRNKYQKKQGTRFSISPGHFGASDRNRTRNTLITNLFSCAFVFPQLNLAKREYHISTEYNGVILSVWRLAELRRVARVAEQRGLMLDIITLCNLSVKQKAFVACL